MSNAKTILITGATTGFGRDAAETLARAGHTVFASMRQRDGKNREHADALRRLAATERVAIEVLDLDVSVPGSAERAIEGLLRQSDRLDVLINNAGIFSAGVTEAFTPEQAQALFDVNVVGMLRVSRAALPIMRHQRDGLVINVGSILGRLTFPFFGLYGASKFAVEALTDSLRYELSQLGIDVVLVQPSAYPTAMYGNALQPAEDGRVAEYGAVGKIPGAMFQHFLETFQSPGAPNPHDVAEAITRLVDQPKGTRPPRTVVGASFGADAVNEQTAPVQTGVVEALGLAHLVAVA